jgi:C1A family cysteine protease
MDLSDSAFMPPVFDQGDTSSCVGNSTGAMCDFVELKEGHLGETVSRLFIYWNGRAPEHAIKEDAGCQIRDAIKGVAKFGVCMERTWPFNPLAILQRPSPQAFLEAKRHKVLSYWRVARDIAQMEGCLAHGWPFVFGISIYDSFESSTVTKTGIVPMPGPTETLQGGHAVLAVGYDKKKQMLLCRNSWGTHWGLKGHFWLPYAFAMNPDLSDDFWTIRTEM